MDPIYFGSRLTAYEAAAFVRGVARRRRAGWEQARYIAFFAARPHCKDTFTFESMGRFGWEDSNEVYVEELNDEWNEEIKKLRARALERDSLIGIDDEGLMRNGR